MTQRYVFHLSLPVSDLTAAKDFYVNALGAEVGRQNAEWLDVLVWGHQITLQYNPAEVLPLDRQGKRHFGVILPWAEWEALAARIRAQGFRFLSEPAVLLKDTTEEQAKFYLADPGNNVIEVKAYKDMSATLHVQP